MNVEANADSQKTSQPALCKLCGSIFVSNVALQTHKVKEHNDEDTTNDDDEIEKEINRLFEDSDQNHCKKSTEKAQQNIFEEEDSLEAIEDFLKNPQQMETVGLDNAEDDRDQFGHEDHEENEENVDNGTSLDFQNGSKILNDDKTSWNKLIQHVSDFFTSQYNIKKNQSEIKVTDKLESKIGQPTLKRKHTKMQLYKERLRQMKEQKMIKLTEAKENRIKKIEDEKQERIETRKKEADDKKKSIALKLEMARKERQNKIDVERQNKIRETEEKRAEIRKQKEMIKQNEKEKIKIKPTKNRTVRNEMQKITLDEDGTADKFVCVPTTRLVKIESVVESPYRGRIYKNDFTNHFKGQEQLDIKQATGNLSSTSKTTMESIRNLVEKVLTEDDSYVDNEQKRVLLELYPPAQAKLLPCKLCSKSFSQWSTLQRHNKIDHEKRLTTRCTLCKISFPTPELQYAHKMKFHKKKQSKDITCKFCAKFFASASVHDKHVKSVHNGVVTKCKICDKTFSFRENMLRHMRQVHTDIRPFQCTFCDMFFGDSGNLKRHIRTRHFNIRIPCHICDRPCWDKGDLKRHIFEKHSDPIVCQKCGKDFLSIAGLTIHQNKYHAETPIEYPCSECSYTFLTPQDRSTHNTKVHSDEVEPVFRCRFCHEKFKTKIEKIEHTAIHNRSEAYTYACQFCGKMKSTDIRRKMHEIECTKNKSSLKKEDLVSSDNHISV